MDADKKYQLFVKDLVFLLKEKLEKNSKDTLDIDPFILGTNTTLYDVLDLIKSQSIAFDIVPEEIGFDGFVLENYLIHPGHKNHLADTKTDIVSKEVIPLLQQLLDRHINHSQFERDYMNLWRRIRDEHIILPERAASLLNRLFTACDTYCADPSLRNSNDLSDRDLYNEVKEVFNALGVKF